MLLAALERMGHHLTAAVVSSEPAFLHEVLSRTVNGTTVRFPSASRALTPMDTVRWRQGEVRRPAFATS